MAKKKVKIFPYQIQTDAALTGSSLKSKFSKTNLLKNILKYGDCSLLMIVESVDGDFVKGRFMKLRHNAPAILNKLTQKEREIKLKENEVVKEESMFILNLNDRILLGEYNYESIRHFSFPLRYYWFKMIGGSFIVSPVPTSDAYKQMKKDREIIGVEISIPQEHLSHREQSGLSPLFGLTGLSSNDESVIRLKISRGRKKENKLKKDEVIREIDRWLERKDDLFTLKAMGREGAYDLLNGNLVCYTESVDIRSNRTSMADFFRVAEIVYNNEIAYLKSLISF